MTNNVTAFILRNEGIRLHPYHCPGGYLTIGVGRNLDALGITKAEALYLLANDIRRVERSLDEGLLWWRELSEVRQAVLIDMCFNLGFNGLLRFVKMLMALQRGDWSQAAAEIRNSDYYSQVGDRAKRLIRMVETDEWGVAWPSTRREL